MMPEQQQRILGYFIEEAKDHLNTIEQGLLNLQATIGDSEMVNEVFRAAHSIKGGAAMLGIESVQRTSHRLEDYFKVIKESPIRTDRTLESMFLQVFDGLQSLVEELQGPFGLTDEKAQEVMADIEPVFGQLEKHLNTLVANAENVAPVAVPTAPSTPAVTAPPHTEESALKLVFRSDVPGHLREMLGLFKQPDNATSRSSLQATCDALLRIGEQFELVPWCELVQAARSAVGNPEQTYRTLAPVIIKDLKQGQERVMGGRANDITPSAAMQDLLPPPAMEEPASVTTDADLEALLDDALAAPEEESDLAALFASDAGQAVAELEDAEDLTWLDSAPAPEDDRESEDLDRDFTDDFAAAFAGADLTTPTSEESVLPPSASPAHGPEVGAAELNSLADLFEGETWQEDADTGEELTDRDGLWPVGDHRTPLDIDIPSDFSDLMLSEEDDFGGPDGDDMDSQQELASLFGDTALEGGYGSEEADSMTEAGVEGEDFSDLFGIEDDVPLPKVTAGDDLDALLEQASQAAATTPSVDLDAFFTEPALDQPTTADEAAVADDLGDLFETGATDLEMDTTADDFGLVLDSDPDANVAEDDLFLDSALDMDALAEIKPPSDPLEPESGDGDGDFEAVFGGVEDGASEDSEDLDFGGLFNGDAAAAIADASQVDGGELNFDDLTFSPDEDGGLTSGHDPSGHDQDNQGLDDQFDALFDPPGDFGQNVAIADETDLGWDAAFNLANDAVEDVDPSFDSGNEVLAEAGDLDFDLDLDRFSTDGDGAESAPAVTELDLDLGVGADLFDVPEAELDLDLASSEVPPENNADLDWDLDLDPSPTSSVNQRGDQEIEIPTPAAFDLATDLDLSGLDADDLMDDLFGGEEISPGDSEAVAAATSDLDLSGLDADDLMDDLFGGEEISPGDSEAVAAATSTEVLGDLWGDAEVIPAPPSPPSMAAAANIGALEDPWSTQSDGDEDAVDDASALDALDNLWEAEHPAAAPVATAAGDDEDSLFEDFADLSLLEEESEEATSANEDLADFFGIDGDSSAQLTDSPGESTADLMDAVAPTEGSRPTTEEADLSDVMDDASALFTDNADDLGDLGDLDLFGEEAATDGADEVAIGDVLGDSADFLGDMDPLDGDSLFGLEEDHGTPEPTESPETSETADPDFENLDFLLEDEATAATEEGFEDLDALLGDEDLDSATAEANADESEEGFDDLEAMLAEDEALATGAAEEFGDLDALLSEEEDFLSGADGDEMAFGELDALLDDDGDGSAAVDDEFGDLEKLLEAADKSLGGSSPTMRGGSGGARINRRVGAMVDQTMRVSVKHLDTLSNLVGELVVNRNSLEQDQERLRQFLDNLLFQVQQLNDVGQRMRDLYERSLLESSLISSRHAFHSGGSTVSHRGGNEENGGGGHATGATFDALEMDRFTGFHTLSQEMIELIVRVRESASDIGYTVESSDQITRQFRQVTTQLQEGLNKARMVPFAQTADRLPRAVRDISLKCGKEARLVVEGRDTLIDKMILERLYDPMTHLVNNAITHGIEPPDERVAAGKTREGTITVRAFYQGNQTVIYIADDGGGINPDIVKQQAIKKGLITQAEARSMSVLETHELLFRPGFSTRDKADDFAGRGVGMDVVRTALSEIRGAVTIDSEMGKGTSFTIRLPLTLSISKALSCLNNQARIAFPMDGVEDMFDVPKERVQTNDVGQSSILWRDTNLSFQPLSDLLQFNRTLGRGRVYGGTQDDDMVSIVVLRSANTHIGLQVDRVLGEQEIVIKQLEGPVPKPVGIAGATVLGDGRVMPIADVLELIDIAQGRVRRESGSSLWSQDTGAPATEALPLKAEPTVLIVDDSITVRELLSMSFNKVGYRVEQARDGQEAWEKLRSGLPCDLVFCDIEMPRMDGLELLSRMQKDSSLKHVPIAMLTSRGADRHRQMALDLGANGYFTKPYLEEALLDAAQRMLNGEVLLHAKPEEE
ncbi:response regulator [Leptolyngbya sp. PCC 6406]|uniref:hybrid sensor histidine kinase/response regulator n=1 Tax=Leptolyngbya sp. PCC 6406 TaxID=1173264 RepID=UPI000483E2E6|nr:response regulator [Leptolyngbya sp. PCC 6406]